MRCAVIWTGVWMLLGCTETELSRVSGQISVTPGLHDLGTLTVGDQATVAFVIEAENSHQVSVDSIQVVDVEGEWFSAISAAPFGVNRSEAGGFQVVYAPMEVGYHHAIVSVLSDANAPLIELDVRGRAVELDVQIIPTWIDFGLVEPAAVAVESVSVINYTGVAIEVQAAAFTDAVFDLGVALPITVEAGYVGDLPVTFSPTNEEPAAGQVVFTVEGVDMQPVQLRGNDCENGVPSAYDIDGDGYAVCGGDCDDGDPDIHPGAEEVYDHVDQDCDEIADEGTEGYDDDGDGFCEHSLDCELGVPGDCNDGVATVAPNMPEHPGNGIDDDCDGVVDAGSPDGDGDGFTEAGGDCDDADPAMHPGHVELPDFKDNDCDNTIDELTVLYDDDGDGFCEDPGTCSDGSLPYDCDDDVDDVNFDSVPDGRATYPGAVELTDWQDNNCDGRVDDGTVNFDDDGDGFTESGGDCDDTNSAVSPATGNCP